MKRIEKNTNLHNLVEILARKIRTKDFQSLLLSVYEARTNQLKTDAVIKQYSENRFVQCSDVNQREIIKFDNLTYGVIPSEFESVELSPVEPLGTNMLLTKINQKNVLSTIRNSEVLADSTIALALECAKRRKIILAQNPRSTKIINLCTSHRLLRLQQFDKKTKFTPHFRLFAICSAGRVRFDEFEIENLKKHICIFLNLFQLLNVNDYLAQNINVAVSDIRIAENIISRRKINRAEIGRKTQEKEFNFFEHYKIQLPPVLESSEEIRRDTFQKYGIEKNLRVLTKIREKVIEPLKSLHPTIGFQIDLDRIAGIGYYTGLCFKIFATNKNQLTLPLVDGGFTDWTKKLLNNKKEILLTSGIGSELFCRYYKTQ